MPGDGLFCHIAECRFGALNHSVDMDGQARLHGEMLETFELLAAVPVCIRKGAPVRLLRKENA